MGWLDKFISGFLVLVNGTEQVQPGAVNYIGAVSAAKSGDQLNLTFTGTAGAPTTAGYVVTSLDAGIPNAQVLTGSSSIDVEPTTGVATVSCVMGTTAGTVCDGADARLSDARVPITHSHAIETITATSGAAFLAHALVKRSAAGVVGNTGACSEGIATTAATGSGQSIVLQTKGLITLPDAAFSDKPTGTYIGEPVFANGPLLTYVRDTTPGNSFEQVGTIWFADSSPNTTIINVRIGSLGYNIAI